MPQFAHSSSWRGAKRLGRGALLLRLCLALLLTGGAAGAYFYWPQLYFHFTGSALGQLQQRSEEAERRLLDPKEDQKQLLAFFDETHQLINTAEAGRGASAWLCFYRGLFNLYELFLRVSHDSTSLIELTGRGFVPLQKELGDKNVSLLQLGRKIAIPMRKALALSPDLQEAPTAHLALVYGNLFLSGRTDKRDLRRLEESREIRLSPLRERYRNWMQIAFYALFGQERALTLLLQHKEQEHKGREHKGREEIERERDLLLPLSTPEQEMLLCHAHYYARKYVEALRFARRAKRRSETPLHLVVEATRMEAEIFYLQRGSSAAIPYLRKALEFTEGRDSFIKKRLEQWSLDS